MIIEKLDLQICREIVEDNAVLVKIAHLKAKELNRKYRGLGITWRELAILPAAKSPKPAARSPSRSGKSRSKKAGRSRQ